MGLTNRDFEKILQLGIDLTTTKNRDKLLESIVDNGMEITNCDGGTLYLYEDGMLKFRIMRTLSQNVDRGRDGQEITDIPPVNFKEENVCAYSAIHHKVVNIPDVYHSEMFDFAGPKRYDALTGYRTESMLVIPIENNENELIGVLQMINAKDGNGKVIPFDEQYEIIIHSLSSLAAIELTNLRYTKEIKLQMQSFVEAMATAIDARTPYNGNHTRMVAKYAMMLAEKINEKQLAGETEEIFDEERMEKLRLAALLHDIGKMIIPKSVMNKATRLDAGKRAVEDRFALLKCCYERDFYRGSITREVFEAETAELAEWKAFIDKVDSAGFLPDEDLLKVQELGTKRYTSPDGEQISYLTEWELENLCIRKGTLSEEDRRQMESHVEMTAKILSKVYFNKNYEEVPKWAAMHHEFLNGTGYPERLSGDALPIEARILTIVDVYDALTCTDRPYKKPMPKEKALAILGSMVEEGKMDKTLVQWLSEAVQD